MGMLREEAIQVLRDWDGCFIGHRSDDVNEALNMAIKALEQEPTTKNDLGVDCISRADAIRVASGYCHPSNVAKELAKLPSVTPQEPQTFKWCTDCKEYDQEKHCCHRWSKVIRDTVEEMKQAPSWIPVSERLPETNTEVLATTTWGDVTIADRIGGNNWFIQEGNANAYTEDIVAWMPKPKAYKREER